MIIRKLIENVFHPHALAVLGPRAYAAHLGRLMARAPAIVSSRSLQPADVGAHARRFRYRGHDIRFDCAWNDDAVRDGSYAFGAAREILVRDVYFRHLPAGTYEGIRTALDLGANRGLVSVLLAATADRVVAVEAQAEFLPVIQHNLDTAGAAHVALVHGFAGAGGTLGDLDTPVVTMADLVERLGGWVDFAKIDIEGSEFDLFRHDGWLPQVGALAAELHDSDDPTDRACVREALERNRFTYVLAHEDLSLTDSFDSASYVYAWNRLAPSRLLPRSSHLQS